MRTYHSGLAYFDNSVPDYGQTASFKLGSYDKYGNFDNGIKVKKNNFLFITNSGDREFDNSIAQYIQTANKVPIVGKYSTVATFDNSVKRNKQFLKFNVMKTARWFDNSVNVFDGGTKPDVLMTGKPTSTAWFDNNYMGAFDFDIGLWSVGVFDLFSKVSVLALPEYGYEEAKSELNYPNLGYNWFDNSIPSYKVFGQGKVIPWGFNKTDFQFSFRFPAYGMDLQADVAGVIKACPLEVQGFATPPIEVSAPLEVSAEIELDKYNLELQMNKGAGLSKLLSLQGEVLKDIINPLLVQYKTEYTDNTELELQGCKVQISTEELEIQSNIDGLIVTSPLDLQGWKIQNGAMPIDIQNEVLTDRIEVFPIQSVVYAEEDRPLELQLNKVYNDSNDLGIQYKKVYIENSELAVQSTISGFKYGLEMQVFATPPLPAESKLDLQVFATPPIPTSETLELQFQKTVEGQEELEVGFCIDRFVTDKALDVQWLQSAKIDSGLEVSFESIQEMKVRFQGEVIPLGQTDVLSQARVLPVNYAGLELQVDTTMVKEYILELQNNIVIETEAALAVQGNVAELSKTYTLDVQAWNNVEKEYALGLQCITDERADNTFELQANANVEMEAYLGVSVDITELNKWYKLETQLNVSHVTKNEALALQGSVSHITTKIELGLQLDVLDLVYYMLYEGYNIVPWWSDGKGQWDIGVDKNWVKNETPTTAGNGIRQQLDDLGLLSPEEFEMFDLKTRNFMYYNKLLDNTVGVGDSIIRLQHTGDKKHLTLGKSKKETTDTIELKEGKNVVFYDGIEDTFDAAIRQHIQDSIEDTLVWDPRTNSWELFWEDRPVYFYEEINGKELAMPYVFVIVAKEDCTVPVLR